MAAAAPGPAGEIPRLAEGLEVGCEEPAGGGVVAFLPPDRFFEISSVTAQVLRLIDGHRDVSTLARLVSAQLSSDVSATALRDLIDRTLAPRGLILYGAPTGMVTRPIIRPRGTVIPACVPAIVAPALAFGLRPAIAAGALVSIVGAHLWFYLAHTDLRLGDGRVAVWVWPAVLALHMASNLVHEFGHATALQSFGVRPGAISLGARWWRPHWSADVSGIWKLRRRERVVVDLGGAYFQLLFTAALILISALTRDVVTARAVLLVDVTVLLNLLPLRRTDGFWLAADLAGTRFPRARPTAPDDPRPLAAVPTAARSGVYPALYAALATASFVSLWMWLGSQAADDTAGTLGRVLRLPATIPSGTLRPAAMIEQGFSLLLRVVVLAGMVLALGTGLGWISGAVRRPRDLDSRARTPGGA